MQNCWVLKLTEQKVTNRLYKVTWYTQHWPVISDWLLWITVFPLIFLLSLKYNNLHAQHFELVSVLNPQAVHTGRCQVVSFRNWDNGWNVKQTLFIHIFKQDQQDVTLHNGIYYYKRSTCFGRFLRPSSGAQNCIHSIGYLSSFFCFLPLSWVGTHDSQHNAWHIPTVVYTGKYLLMMSSKPAWTM
jgi:hypothetical protein